jgi:hypothetical protein
LDSQYQQIYADVRGGYLSNSLSDTAAGVISSVQGRPGQTVTPGSLVRATIALLEVYSFISRLTQAEFDVIHTLFPAQYTEILISTATGALGQVSRAFKAVTTQIRTNPSQNLPLTLSILDDISIVQDLMKKTSLPKEALDNIRKETLGMERDAKGVGGVGISDVLEEIKRRGATIVSLPSDGNLIDLTGDVSPYS